ncbi:MAG: hypothetical protein ACI8Q1_002191 [Parvicella sp.]|jgi:hypothetical protein
MVLNPKKVSIIHYQDREFKRYKAKYSSKKFFDEIVHIIDSAEVRKLPDTIYSIIGADFSSITLRIYYDDGKEKDYFEYGLQNEDVAKLLYKKLDKEHNLIQTHLNPPKVKKKVKKIKYLLPRGVWIKKDTIDVTTTYISSSKFYSFKITFNSDSLCSHIEGLKFSDRKDSVFSYKKGYLGKLKKKGSNFSISKGSSTEHYELLPLPNFKTDSLINYQLLIASWNEIPNIDYRDIVYNPYTNDSIINITFQSSDNVYFKPHNIPQKFTISENNWMDAELIPNPDEEYPIDVFSGYIIFIEDNLLIFQVGFGELHFFIKE